MPSTKERPQKRARGRPPILVDPVRREVLIERDDYEQLKALAASVGGTVSGLLRSAMDLYLREASFVDEDGKRWLRLPTKEGDA